MSTFPRCARCGGPFTLAEAERAVETPSGRYHAGCYGRPSGYPRIGSGRARTSRDDRGILGQVEGDGSA